MTVHSVSEFSNLKNAPTDHVRVLLPAAALSQRSIARWLAALITDYAVVALAMAGAYCAFVFARQSGFTAIPDAIAGLVIVLAIIVIGTRQHAILVLAHDGSHGLVSSNPRWNDLLTNLLSLWPFGIALSGYRKVHFAHHRYMGTEADPEMGFKKYSEPKFDLPASAAHILGLSAAAMAGFGMRDQAYVVKYIVTRDSLRDVLASAAMFSLFALTLWYFGAWWVALLWFGAFGTSFWAIFFLRTWTEHIGTADVHRISARLFYRLIFLPHNTWCHFEHHRFPSVPFWNLPKARALDSKTSIRTLESLFASFADRGLIPSGTSSATDNQREAA